MTLCLSTTNIFICSSQNLHPISHNLLPRLLASWYSSRRQIYRKKIVWYAKTCVHNSHVLIKFLFLSSGTMKTCFHRCIWLVSCTISCNTFLDLFTFHGHDCLGILNGWEVRGWLEPFHCLIRHFEAACFGWVRWIWSLYRIWWGWRQILSIMFAIDTLMIIFVDWRHIGFYKCCDGQNTKKF